MLPIQSIRDVEAALKNRGIGAYTFRVYNGQSTEEMLDIPGAIQFFGPRGEDVFDLTLHPFNKLVHSSFLVGDSMIRFDRADGIHMIVEDVELEKCDSSTLVQPEPKTEFWMQAWC